MQPDLLMLLSPKNIVIFAIIFTRISGMIMSAPLFSTFPIPIQVKIWLTALVSFILFPIISSTLPFSVPASFPELSIYLLREFGVGFMIGFIANLIFAAVQIGGEFISIQIGISMSQILNPETGLSTPVLAQIYIIFVAFVFMALNAHQWLFAAVYRSFKTFPPGLDFVFTGSVVEHIVRLSGEMFAIAISMILPIFCVMFVAEVLMGFMSKMMPQMNIFMVAIPLKVYLGLILMLMFISPTATYLANTIESYLKGIVEMMI